MSVLETALMEAREFTEFLPSFIDTSSTLSVGFTRDDKMRLGCLAWECGSDKKVLPSTYALLDETERNYSDHVLTPLRRQSFLLGRTTAKRAVAVCRGGVPPRSVRIRAGVFSQPVVDNNSGQPLCVSITHCENWVFSLAFPEDHPMGIDIEESRPGHRETILSQLTQSERCLGAAQPGSDQLWPLVFWTAKEALSKVLRCGLTCPMHVLELSVLASDGTHFCGEFKNFGQYRFISLKLSECAVLAIVLPRCSRLVHVQEPASRVQA